MTRLLDIEFYVGNLIRSGISFIISLLLEVEKPGQHIVRESFHFQVITLHRFVVILARDVDPVLRALDLGLEILEGLGGLQVGIVFKRSDQPAE